jgi:hypothetical protein
MDNPEDKNKLRYILYNVADFTQLNPESENDPIIEKWNVREYP